jgi:hypothetical protein
LYDGPMQARIAYFSKGLEKQDAADAGLPAM